MRQIDDLCAMLVEAGVEFEYRNDSTSYGKLGFVKWCKEPDEIDGIRWKFKASELPGDALLFYVSVDYLDEVRPVIEATLGRRTCHPVRSDGLERCSECDETLSAIDIYCAHCGRRIER